MHRRIVVVVAGVLFGLLALMAGIVTDLYDREFPQAIGAQSRIGLDFSDSTLTDAEAFAALEELDAGLRLGLVKVAPDLAGNDDGQVFVPLNEGDLPAEFHWFGGSDAGRVLGKDRLAHSPPDGTYLVAGDTARLAEFEETLVGVGVEVHRTDASVADSFGFVVREASFGAAVLAAFALIAALALFWLSMKARGRALRVLGGCPTARIQVQDLGGFLGGLVVSAVSVAAAAAVYVGVAHGWMHVAPFLQVLVSLQAAVIATSMLAALAMSVSAWPSATMLATRQPAVRSLRRAAIVIQALTFLLVIAAAGPAWAAYKSSSATAAEVAQWKQLADQVAIRFSMSGMSDEEMDDSVAPQVGELVREAESLDAAAFSYTLTEEWWEADFGDYSAVSFVNQRWLDLLTTGVPQPALTSVPFNQVQEMVVHEFGDQMELWSRSEMSGDQILAQFQYLEPADGFRLPVTVGHGDLLFLDDVLVAVVPSLHQAVDDRNLTSMISTTNIVFSGLAQTQVLLERHGLAAHQLRAQGVNGELHVVYIAEEGILIAQFAMYVTWLLNLALLALLVAFAVAAAISAVITARLHAKRDFPLRLAGRSWARILQTRVATELLAGAGLVAIVLLLQRPDETVAVLVAAAFGSLIVPLSHLAAARWCFAGVGRRRM